MSCNTKTSLAAVIDAVNAQLNNNYVDRDDPRINQGVFTEPTIRGGLMLDEAAKLDFCGYVTECGQQEPFGKQWIDRPLYPENMLVSYDDKGEVKSKWQGIEETIATTMFAETRRLGLEGFVVVDSFELGATLTQGKDALRHTTTGKLYRWAGGLPKVVPAGSTPAGTGGLGANAWVEVSDIALRQELMGSGGVRYIGNAEIKVASVAELETAPWLKVGMVVRTDNYYSDLLGGGARYTIMAAATDYSIPLANGLHAVFNDTFDIRKFGIVDDPTFTLAQDDLLTKMCRYADEYSYLVDFHGFSIKTPQKLFYPTGRGLQYRGLGFNKMHHITNLKMSHNVGEVSQIDGLTHIHIRPLSYDDIEGVLKFSNITLDGYIQNYTPTVGESDGGFNGIVVETHNLENTMWNKSNHREFPLDIIFENINFIRPCMSYGIAAASFKSRSITGRGIRGEIVGLAAFVYARDIKFDEVDILYRDDLHTPGRELVRSAIHVEPEMGPDGTSDIDTIKLSDINIKDTTGEYGLGFFMYVRGKINVNEITFTDFKSNIILDSMPSKGGLIKKCTIKDAKKLNIISKIDNLSIDNCLMQNWDLKDIDNQRVKEVYPLAYLIFKTLEISRCSIIGPPVTGYFEGDKLILDECFIRGYGNVSIFKASGKVKTVEINKGRFQMESAAIYEGLNDVITVNDSKFLDVSTGFTKVTNPDINTGKLELNNVHSDGVITAMVAADRKSLIVANNVRFPNLLSLSIPRQCRMIGAGINSFGYQATMPTPFVVAAKQVKTWKIDLPHFAAKGDFRIRFFNENNCMVTVSNPADLSNINQIKVQAFNPTDEAIDLSGVSYFLEFTTIST